MSISNKYINFSVKNPLNSVFHKLHKPLTPEEKILCRYFYEKGHSTITIGMAIGKPAKTVWKYIVRSKGVNKLYSWNQPKRKREKICYYLTINKIRKAFKILRKWVLFRDLGGYLDFNKVLRLEEPPFEKLEWFKELEKELESSEGDEDV